MVHSIKAESTSSGRPGAVGVGEQSRGYGRASGGVSGTALYSDIGTLTRALSSPRTEYKLQRSIVALHEELGLCVSHS